MLAEKVFVGLENTPHAFDLCGRVLGQGGANLDFIRSETGAVVMLKGGSGDKANPLHLALNHSRGERLAAARQLALSLVESVRQEFQQWSAQNTPATPPVPALNVPPPIMVKPPPPVQTAPPPTPVLHASLPLNITPMQHQVLQLVPQQQIFVAPDGSHYVKVTFAQTPMTNTGPLMTMSLPQGQVNVIPQPMQVPPVNVMPQLPQAPMVNAHGFSQLPMQAPMQVIGPSVCSAPTLSTQSVTQREQLWPTLQQQLQPIPASSTSMWSSPSQHAAVPAPAPHVNTSAPPPLNVSQPWAAPVPAQQTVGTSVGGNLPWYKNSQNTASCSQQENKSNENRQLKSRMIADERSESSEINNSGSGKQPVWETGSVNALPDLLDEIKKDNENERSSGSRSRSGRDSRRERRDRRRRPYTDADTYRRQFRSGGVLGEDRHGDRKDENTAVQESEVNPLSKDEKCACDTVHVCGKMVSMSIMSNAGQGGAQRTDRYASGQIAVNVSSSSSTSKWDRPAAQITQPQGNQYNQSGSSYYQQAGYQNQSAYQQSNPYGQPAQQNKPTGYQQPPQENKSAIYQQTQNNAENQVGSRNDKQTPTTQYVGAPTQYTATASNWMANQNQYYQNEEKPTWSQSQHPWNRNGQGEPPYGAAQYGERPWGNTAAASIVAPPASHLPYPTEDASNKSWSTNY